MCTLLLHDDDDDDDDDDDGDDARLVSVEILLFILTF